MEREHRYMVVKYKDILKYLTENEQVTLIELAKKVDSGRERDGRRQLACVCVEDDWPEYEGTWAKIAQRVDGLTQEQQSASSKCEMCGEAATINVGFGNGLCHQHADEFREWLRAGNPSNVENHRAAKSAAFWRSGALIC